MKKVSTILFLLFYNSLMADVNVDSLLSKMSLEEKVGQMCQIDLGVVAKGPICQIVSPQQIDTAKLKTAIQKYQVGSILNVGCGANTMSRENWNYILSTIDYYNKKYNRLQTPILYGIDAIHGVNYTKGATLFPQQLAQAATWNPELILEANQISAYETRATGIPWNFSPVLDIGRQPLWSRFFETYGEDVYLAKQMAKAAINGLQNGINKIDDEHVAACMKHFLGYSLPWSGRDRTPVMLGERELREYFLPTFRVAINEGAASLMINSGEINGIPVHVNPKILTELLRDELKFEGVAVTDWEDIWKLVNVHHVATDKKDAVYQAISAGVDMSMVPNDFEFCDLLIALVKEGKISEERINISVGRILQMKKKLGLFENTGFTKRKSYPKFGSDEHKKKSYMAASECLTLLKNENNCLPLTSQQKILVCGPTADNVNLLNGAWTHSWQGDYKDYTTPGTQTILQSLSSQNNNVRYVETGSIDSSYNIEKCVQEALKVDKIVLCIGEKPSTEIPGNIDRLAVSEAQDELIMALISTKKPIILVCTFNRPLILKKYIPFISSILYTYYPGDQGGPAISDVIYGKVNPSGKLPFTYPSDYNALLHYDRKFSEDIATDFSMNGYNPAFDFGFGLSYTNFEYSNLELSTDTMKKSDKITVSVNVKNTGKLKGKEVVQVYYQDKVASITPSVKKLCSFRKIELEPGKTSIVEFIMDRSTFSFVNNAMKTIVEPGEFSIFLGSLKKDFYVE